MKNAIYLHISVPNIFNMLWQCLLVWSLFWKFSNLGENWDNEEMRSNVEMRSAQYSLAIPEWSLEEIWVSFHPNFPPNFILTKLSANGQFYRFSGKFLDNWQKLPVYGKLPRLEISWKSFYFTRRFAQENSLSHYESLQMKKLFHFISLSMAFMLNNLGSCL